MKPRPLPTRAAALAALLALAAPSSALAEREEDKPASARPGAERPEAEGRDRPAPRPERPERSRPRGAPRTDPPYPPHLEERSRPREAPPGPRGAAPAVKRAFLGVATIPLPPSLREHLEIPRGFGVQVEHVVKDSPAEKSGLQANDILVLFGDQRLISPEHLSLLVHSQAKGDEIEIQLIRRGREESVSVVLDEREEHEFSRFGPPGGLPRGARDSGQWQEFIKRHQDEWREWMDRHHPDWKGAPDPPEAGRDDVGSPGGRPPAVSVRPGFPLRIFGAEGVLRIDNEQGELILTQEDGDHHIVIKDAEGETVHEGAFDPRQGVEGLPEAAREQLKVMKLENLEVLSPQEPRPEPERTASPEENPAPDPGGEGEIL